MEARRAVTSPAGRGRHLANSATRMDLAGLTPVATPGCAPAPVGDAPPRFAGHRGDRLLLDHAVRCHPLQSPSALTSVTFCTPRKEENDMGWLVLLVLLAVLLGGAGFALHVLWWV